MVETEVKKSPVSVKRMSNDLFAMMEAGHLLKSIIHDKSIELKGMKKLEKKISDMTMEKHIVITNEIRNGNNEHIQYTLDSFAGIQDILDGVAYDLFQDDTDENATILLAIENLKMTYDKENKQVTVKGMARA